MCGVCEMSWGVKRSATSHTTLKLSLLKRFKGRTIYLRFAASGNYVCVERSMKTLNFSLHQCRISLLPPQCHESNHYVAATKSNNTRGSSPYTSLIHMSSFLF